MATPAVAGANRSVGMGRCAVSRPPTRVGRGMAGDRGPPWSLSCGAAPGARRAGAAASCRAPSAPTTRASRERACCRRRWRQATHTQGVDQDRARTGDDTRGVFFFFQAEDGIRDVAVTGVQTCALPIFALTIKRGETLSATLRGLGLAPGEAHAATEALRRYVDPRRLRPGDQYRAYFEIGRASCRERV